MDQNSKKCKIRIRLKIRIGKDGKITKTIIGKEKGTENESEVAIGQESDTRAM